MNAKAVFPAMLFCVIISAISTDSAAEVNWKQCAGTDIRVLMVKHPFTTFIEPRIPAFEALTGIDVSIDVFPGPQYWNQCLIEFSIGAQVDGLMMMPGQSKLYSWKSGWLHPIDAYLADPALTSPGWNIEDFFAVPMEGASIAGHQVGVVVSPEVSLLAYRKDLFERFAMKIPETMEELEAAARFFHGRQSDGKKLIGMALRGDGAAATSQWVDFLYSFGGSWLNAAGNSNLASPEAIAAFTFYGDLLRNYGPARPETLNWIDTTALFRNGKAAMIFDANVFKDVYERPLESEIAGKVGYVSIPAGPAGKVPHVSSWTLAISGTSSALRQQAAWLFIQWACNPANARDALLAGIPVGRKSAWNTMEYQVQDRFPEWTAATLDSLRFGQPQWNPPVLNIFAIREIVGKVITDAIAGRDVAASAQQAADLMNRRMER